MAVATLSLVLALPAAAQDRGGLLEEFRARFQRESFRLGALLQIVGSVQSQDVPGNDGFTISNARVHLGGRLDPTISWFLQMNLVQSPSLLDGVLHFDFDDGFGLDTGAFKVPFSGELLTSAADIDFVNRAQAVTALAPGRQIGAQVRGAAGRLHYAAGLFNGNRLSDNGNDNDDFLIAGRVSDDRTMTLRSGRQARVAWGTHAAWSQDARASLPGLVASYAGDRFLVGGDVRVESGRLLLASEVVWSHLEFDAGPTSEPWGLHVTGGFRVVPSSQLLFRWDRLDADTLASDTDLLLFGWNYFPTEVSELQVNYVISAQDGFDSQQVLVNVQVSL